MSKRISLSEVSKKAPKILARGDSQLLAEGAPPTLQDLAGALQFALGDGRIWLNDQRMLLVQAEVLGQLRSAMIEEIGMDRTRERFLQIGWQQGVRHARLVAERFGKSNMTAALAAGPRVHTMEGHAKAITKRFEFNAKKQEYLGEFHWLDSSEGTEHMRNFGICECPVCWMQTAVPSGYTSTLLGFPVIFREIECVAQGAQRCVIVGKDAASWGDELPELKILGVNGTPRPKAKPWTPPVDIEAVKTAQSDFVIGTSPAIQRVRRLIERAGACRQPVMFIGEQGSGKEDFARYLHSVGETPKGPFVPVSCFALDGLKDSAGDVLFGDEGLARQAEGGTLFLNDVLALPASIQAKFAHFLYGQPQPRFRIVSAASQSPIDAVETGRFRTDLGYTLSLLLIHAPPLRERRSDLPVLIDHFRKRHTAEHQKTLSGLSGPLLDVLLRYDYPGNVRELSNMIERGVIFAEPGGSIDISHVFTGVESAPQVARRITRNRDAHNPMLGSEDLGGQSLTDMQIDALLVALTVCDWNVSAAARRLGLTRAKLDYRIRKFGLTRQTQTVLGSW